MSWLCSNVGSLSDISRIFLATSAPFCPTHLRNEEGKKKEKILIVWKCSCPSAHCQGAHVETVKGGGTCAQPLMIVLSVTNAENSKTHCTPLLHTVLLPITFTSHYCWSLSAWFCVVQPASCFISPRSSKASSSSLTDLQHPRGRQCTAVNILSTFKLSVFVEFFRAVGFYIFRWVKDTISVHIIGHESLTAQEQRFGFQGFKSV